VTIIVFPAIRAPVSAGLQLLGSTQQHVSPFDGSVQTLAMPGQRWRASMTWGPIPHTDWRPLQAFLGSLRGRAGRFTYVHPHTYRRATAAPGTPRVDGDNQTGIELATDGWTPSVLVMRAGDFLSFEDAAGRRRMHHVLADVTSDSAGEATLSLVPPLRSAPADNTALDVLTPSPVWSLAMDDSGLIDWHARNVLRAGLTLEIVESLHGVADDAFFLDGSLLG
jgi:hypothetical protein